MPHLLCVTRPPQCWPIYALKNTNLIKQVLSKTMRFTYTHKMLFTPINLKRRKHDNWLQPDTFTAVQKSPVTIRAIKTSGPNRPTVTDTSFCLISVSHNTDGSYSNCTAQPPPTGPYAGMKSSARNRQGTVSVRKVRVGIRARKSAARDCTERSKESLDKSSSRYRLCAMAVRVRGEVTHELNTVAPAGLRDCSKLLQSF
ncbi:hypothetical protein J6590_038077 [Homalodisca vitripennis]|nr:hypothetical protein J6590_038077 [Homalodisca vitripennis]